MGHIFLPKKFNLVKLLREVRGTKRKKRVYVMECGDFVKIGVSDNVDRRAKQIPYKVKRVYASEFLDNAYELEADLHRHYKTSRKQTSKGREYFEISFKEACEKLDEFLNAEPVESKHCTFKHIEDILIEQHPEIKRIGLDAYVIDRMIKAFPSLSEFDKGYFLGKVESLADEADRKAEDKAESKT